jgi:glycosyltransferase involved in cell wall biosynthesis
VKVLFTASTFPRWRDDRLPDFVWQQVRWITRVRPDLRAFVLAPHDAGAPRIECWDGVELRRFRYFWPATLQRLAYPAIWPNIQRSPWLALQVPFLLLFEFLATLRWIRRERFAMIYSHWFMPQGVACGLAALVTRTPHAFTSHSSDVAVMRRIPVLGPWLVRLLVRRARAVTAVSTRSRDVIAGFFREDEWRGLAEKVSVIPMGVEVAQMPASEAGSQSDEAPAFAGTSLLFLGRLAEKKGVEYLLRAMATEALEPLDAELTIAGDGPLLDSLRAIVRSLGLSDRVRFPGFVTGAAKARLVRGADVVVVPSIVTAGGDAEGIPVALLEALAAGKICVATDASGAPEIVHGDAAFIVPQKDPPALARAIVAAARLSVAERRAMQTRAREAAQRFDWRLIAQEHVRRLFPAA